MFTDRLISELMDRLISELMRTEYTRRHDKQHIIFNYRIINTKFVAGREKCYTLLYPPTCLFLKIIKKLTAQVQRNFNTHLQVLKHQSFTPAAD
jgi:hypothetical protein